jgi:acid phosphatase
MLSQIALAALLSAGYVAAQANSTVVGVFMLGRHGDRTSKIMGNTQLTTLGKNQVFQSAEFFRGRYLNPMSPDYIQGVDSDYLYNQIYAAAPCVQSVPYL